MDDLAWLRRRKKRAVSLGGGLPHTMSSHTHSRPLVNNTQCVVFPKEKMIFFYHEKSKTASRSVT